MSSTHALRMLQVCSGCDAQSSRGSQPADSRAAEEHRGACFKSAQDASKGAGLHLLRLRTCSTDLLVRA